MLPNSSPPSWLLATATQRRPESRDKGSLSRGAAPADGLSGGPCRSRGVACVASAGGSGGSGGVGGCKTAWVTTPRASPTSEKCVWRMWAKPRCRSAEGGRAGRLHIPAHMGPAGAPAVAPSRRVSPLTPGPPWPHRGRDRLPLPGTPAPVSLPSPWAPHPLPRPPPGPTLPSGHLRRPTPSS